MRKTTAWPRVLRFEHEAGMLDTLRTILGPGDGQEAGWLKRFDVPIVIGVLVDVAAGTFRGLTWCASRR